MNIVGQRVEHWHAPDASLQIKCPFCHHWTPKVPVECVTVRRDTGKAEWLDCACLAGQGQAAHGMAENCQCVARYRLGVQDATGRYSVTEIDYQTMQDRMMTREEHPLDDISQSPRSWSYPITGVSLPPQKYE